MKLGPVKLAFSATLSFASAVLATLPPREPVLCMVSPSLAVSAGDNITLSQVPPSHKLLHPDSNMDTALKILKTGLVKLRYSSLMKASYQ